MSSSGDTGDVPGDMRSGCGSGSGKRKPAEDIDGEEDHKKDKEDPESKSIVKRRAESRTSPLSASSSHSEVNSSSSSSYSSSSSSSSSSSTSSSLTSARGSTSHSSTSSSYSMDMTARKVVHVTLDKLGQDHGDMDRLALDVSLLDATWKQTSATTVVFWNGGVKHSAGTVYDATLCRKKQLCGAQTPDHVVHLLDSFKEAKEAGIGSPAPTPSDPSASNSLVAHVKQAISAVDAECGPTQGSSVRWMFMMSWKWRLTSPSFIWYREEDRTSGGGFAIVTLFPLIARRGKTVARFESEERNMVYVFDLDHEVAASEVSASEHLRDL